MARRDGSHKLEALARRRAFGRIRLAAVGFVLGCLLGATVAGILLRVPPDATPEDRTPPHVLSVDPKDGTLLSAGNTTFQVAFSEPLATGPTVLLHGANPIAIVGETFDGILWRGAATIPEGASGPYGLNVASARDLVLNEMSDHTTSYFVDTTAPHTRTFSLNNRTSVPFDVTWDASDGNGSGIASVELRYREGTGPWIPLTISSEATGAYRVDPGEREAIFSFCAQAVDRAGNREEPCAEGVGVDYDATPPGASLLPLSYWALGPLELSAVPANNASTAELRYYFATDNATWQGPFSGGNATSAFRWTFAFSLGAGHYRLSARGGDARGWTEREQSPDGAETALGLDLEAPRSHLNPVSSSWHTEPVTLLANDSDDESGVASVDLYYSYRPNGTTAWSTWTPHATKVQPPWAFPFDFPRGDGRYELTTRARDRAGREEALPPIAQGDIAIAYNARPPMPPTLLLPRFIDPALRRTNATWKAYPAPDVVRFEVHRGATPTFAPDGIECGTSETCVASVSREGRTAWVPLPSENMTSYVRVRTVDEGGRWADGNAYGAVFHGLGYDTANLYLNGAPLPLGVAWSEHLRFAGVCSDCSDAFKVTLGIGQVLLLSLAVPETGDFRLLVLNSLGNQVGKSENPGMGVWEWYALEAAATGTYYVLVDWSSVYGPGNRNEGWYTLSADVLA